MITKTFNDSDSLRCIGKAVRFINEYNLDLISMELTKEFNNEKCYYEVKVVYKLGLR